MKAGSRARPVTSVVVVAAAIALAALPLDASLVERWYSAGLYPHLQRIVTPVSNLVPFALFDPFVIGAGCLAIVWLIGGVRQARRKKRLQPFLVALARLVTAAAAVYVLFVALWGLNYRRVPMTERIVLDRAPPSSEAVLALGLTAVDRLNALHQAAHTEGWRTSPWREHRLREAYAEVQERLSGASPTVPGRLKWSIFGPYFRWTSVDGMINPFGLEAIGNPDLLPFERPFVAAHEWAHLAGYADEAEASFVGWLTCVRAATPAAYSAWLFLYWQVSSEVSAADRRRLSDALAEGPQRDVAAIVERLRRGEVRVLHNISWRMYDQYLKANRVEQGIRSYGAVVNLLVRARFDDGWTPVRQSAVGGRQ